MALALCISAIDDVNTLGRAEVSLALLWPNWIPSQGNFVGLDHLSCAHELVFLVHDDSIDLFNSVGANR